MARSSWKLPLITLPLLKNKNEYLKIKSRRSVIYPDLIGKTIHVHNGKSYKPVTVIEDMVGYRFGEFVPTRSIYVYKKKKKK